MSVTISAEMHQPSFWESGFTFLGFLAGFGVNVALTQAGYLPAKAYSLLAGGTLILTPLVGAMLFCGIYCFVSGLVTAPSKATKQV